MAAPKDLKWLVLAIGRARISKILTQGTLDSTRANYFLEEVLMSDNADTVDIIRAFVPSVYSCLQKIAKGFVKKKGLLFGLFIKW